MSKNKIRMRGITKFAITLLTLSFLVQIGYIGYTIYRASKEALTVLTIDGIFKMLSEILKVEFYVALGTFAEPILFSDLFAQQAKGKTRDLLIGAIILIAILTYEHWETAKSVINGQPITQQIAEELGLRFLAPVIMIISIVLSNRPLCAISALIAVAMTVYSYIGVQTRYGAMGDEAVLVMRVSEIMYGLGLVLGLLGVRRINQSTR